MIPGLSGLVGNMAGTMEMGALAGQGVVGIIGGGILTAIAGAIKNRTAKA
jgi:hypothetical protein